MGACRIVREVLFAGLQKRFILAGCLGNPENQDRLAAEPDEVGFNLNIVVGFVVGVQSTQEIALDLINVCYS